MEINRSRPESVCTRPDNDPLETPPSMEKYMYGRDGQEIDNILCTYSMYIHAQVHLHTPCSDSYGIHTSSLSSNTAGWGNRTNLPNMVDT